MTPESPAGPIPTSRLLVGILLHFCVPAYLLACLVASMAGRPAVSHWGEMPARMLWTAGWFVPVLLIALTAAASVGALLDRRRPRAADDAALSRQRFTRARAQLAALTDPRLAGALDRLDHARPDHRDPRDQQVAADLDAAARTFAAAIASAAADRRPVLVALAADAVERIVLALEEIAEERGRLDEGDARTVAGYLQARYGNDR